MNLIIPQLNEKLICLFDKSALLGSSYGKMGISLYFYYLSRRYKNKKFENIAENILDDIFEKIGTEYSIDLLHGLSGIGLGVNHLVKNGYVAGNINSILSDVDDKIFKTLCYSKYSDNIDVLSKIHILYYLNTRLRDQKRESEQEWLYQELMIQTINDIHCQLSSDFYIAPISYKITYQLPQYLYVLSEIYKSGFYNNKIIKLVEEAEVYILSILPSLNSSKLYLLWGVDSIIQQINMPKLIGHKNLIFRELDTNKILNEELNDKNIYIHDGFSGIYLLLSSIQKYFDKKEFLQYKKSITEKIESSSEWGLLMNEPNYFEKKMGLLNGYCGVSLVYDHLISA